MPFAFTPPDGYRNTTDFPTTPASETAFRDSMQDIADQLRDYINASLATKTQEAWTAPTLVNSWVPTTNVNYESPGYMKDQMGFVHLKGTIESGITTTGTTIFTLPVGYRPAKYVAFPAISSADGSSFTVFRITIRSNGEVVIGSSGVGSNVMHLDGITFLV